MRFKSAGFLLPALALSIMLAAAVFMQLGCGDNSPSDVTTAGGPGLATAALTTGASTSRTDTGSTQTVTGEQPAPYGAGTTSPQSVGSLLDGLQLSDIRWSDHGGYFRIVFEMSSTDGKPVTEVPHADASLSADGKQVRVVLGGIRGLGNDANVSATSLSVGDTVVTSMERIPSGDDQALIYNINLAKASTYSLAGLDSPGRIVVDITK